MGFSTVTRQTRLVDEEPTYPTTLPPGVGAAIRLGHRWVESQHLVLDLLRGRPDGAARELLLALGADEEEFEADLARQVANRPPPSAVEGLFSASTTLRASFHQIMGRAEAFAATRHLGAPDSLDFLLALLWGRPEITRLGFSRSRGITRERIAHALIERGVNLPLAPIPPAERPWVGMHHLDVPRASFQVMQQILLRRYKPETQLRWGFISRGDQVRFSAERGIDLEAIFEEARGTSEERPGE